VEIASQGTGRP